ncbi:MAG: TonB-dependent receptor [candidate division KSB1 bacterium]|nr:TonB-dependent receptor [candidate division KSB1 bacterium]
MPEGEIEKSIRHYNRPHDLTFAKFNGLNRLGNVKLEYSAAWFRDESIQDDQIEAAWDGEQPSMADLTKDEFENLTMNSSFNGVLDFGGLESSWSDDQSDHYEVKADMSFPINASRTSELKVGVKREGNYNQQRRMRTKADLAEGETWQITDEWPLLFENINSSTVKNLNLDGPFSYEGMDPTDHTSSNDNSAEVTAGYIMNSTAWLHQRLHTTVGVRVEHIKNSFTEMWSGKSGSASYTDFFPAFIAKYNITEKTNLRGSITRTQSRLAPISIAPIDREERNPPPYAISRGNPDLEPTTALSYDLMFERYTSRLGYFSVGVFAKQLDNNIMTLETEEKCTKAENMKFTFRSIRVIRVSKVLNWRPIKNCIFWVYRL